MNIKELWISWRPKPGLLRYTYFTGSGVIQHSEEIDVSNRDENSSENLMFRSINKWVYGSRSSRGCKVEAQVGVSGWMVVWRLLDD